MWEDTDPRKQEDITIANTTMPTHRIPSAVPPVLHPQPPLSVRSTSAADNTHIIYGNRSIKGLNVKAGAALAGAIRTQAKPRMEDVLESRSHIPNPTRLGSAHIALGSSSSSLPHAILPSRSPPSNSRTIYNHSTTTTRQPAIKQSPRPSPAPATGNPTDSNARPAPPRPALVFQNPSAIAATVPNNAVKATKPIPICQARHNSTITGRRCTRQCRPRNGGGFFKVGMILSPSLMY